MLTFRPTPLVLAISLAALAGCNTEKANFVSPAEPAKQRLEPEVDRQRLVELKKEVSEALSDSDTHPEARKSNTVHRIAAANGQFAYPPAPAVQGAAPHLTYSEPYLDREQYAQFDTNKLQRTSVEPLSTFGIDVDTASYTLARQMLNQGSLPRRESVRIEEWINYFDAGYSVPESAEAPFSVTTEFAVSPWDADRHLLSIGLKGYEVSVAQLPPMNLTFLIDVSGSMSSPNKLPLAINSLKMLTQQLRPQDRIAVAVYAGAAGLVLDSTPGNEKPAILTALSNLRAGGSTAGGAGIQLAYNVTKTHHKAGNISRVILLSDGDFNVGTTDTEALKKLVEHERQSGVQLSVMTFGRGNIRDELMNTLAENGNGTAAYIDSAQEAKKHLVDGMAGTLMTIAKDTKAQVEFNPAIVSEYRLIGYETRQLEHQAFNDDTRDAGDIGAGHSVTALYEVILHNSPDKLSPRLRYQPATGPTRDIQNTQAELAYLKLRYKQPEQNHSRLIEKPIYLHDLTHIQATSATFRWNAAVAAAAQKARGISGFEQWRYENSRVLAKTAIGHDPYGHRAEFVRLMALAESLDSPIAQASSRD